MSNDIFADGGTTPSVDPNKNYLEELVGEGKKFKAVEDLARGKAESDLYIATMREKYTQLEQELNARKKIEEIVATIVPKSQSAEPTHQLGNPVPKEVENVQSVDHMTPEKLEELIERRLQERERANRDNGNLSKVIEDLKRTFGPDYAQTVAEKAREVGLSKEDMNELAKRSPDAFFRLVGAPQERKPEPDVFAPPRSSVNTTATQGTAHTSRNKAFYDEMKKRDPGLYKSDKTQAQMMNDALRLKDAFFN